MKMIETHKVNPVNDRIEIEVVDEPGSGGAHHRYDVTGFDTETNKAATAPDGYKASFSRMIVLFQNGPIMENGVNGITQEVLLSIVKDRLECFQAGPYACPENQVALDHVECALEVLKGRTRERMNRGVEGRSVK